MYALSRYSALLSLVSLGLAQTPNVVPFGVVGSLDGCTAGAEYNAGGSIQVNGFNIQVPKNLIVAFPTVFAPFKDLCGAGAGGFETTVYGNIVGGTVLAGQISIAQRFGLESSQGYITAINADGSLDITGGVKVRVNDPDGLFGPKVESAPIWVADTSSPSVTSFSGFPMCIPYSGNTETCLSSNRGTGQSFNAPDPLRMVPLKVGDFITYSGLRTGTSEMLVSEIVCISLHITTQASSSIPNYIRVEDLLVGVPDTANNVEFADIRVIGFLSSCANSIVTISAIDVDACTGKETYRQIGTATPKQETRCKWEARIDPGGLQPFTREYRITTNSPVQETKDGLQAGQYISPVTEWIFPEVDVPGTNPPAYPFTDISDLVQGTVLDGKQYGPLSPFPGPAPPAPSKTCSPNDLPDPNATPTPGAEGPVVTPIAAAAPFTAAQRVGTNFLLAGSNTAPNVTNNNLNFKWSQISPSSPSASLTDSTSPTATVNAPKVTTETSFIFELVVSLKSNSTISSKANVTVKVNPTINDVVTMDTYTWESKQSGSIAVSCSSNVVNGDNKKMSLWLNNGNTKLDMTSNAPGKWVYSARSTSRPSNLKCVSDLKGESASRTGTQTTARKRRGLRW